MGTIMEIITEEQIQEIKAKLLKENPKRPITRLGRQLTNLNNVMLAQKIWTDEEELRKYFLQQIVQVSAQKLRDQAYRNEMLKLRKAYRERDHINWTKHSNSSNLLRAIGRLASHFKTLINTVCAELHCDYITTANAIINKAICMIKGYLKMTRHYFPN